VTPLNAAELREAITKPAELVGLKVEPELVQRMIADVQGSPGSLPLLEFALTELWEQWREQWQQLFLTRLPEDDAPKSPFLRGTLTEFSPLDKGGWGGSPGLKTNPRGDRTLSDTSQISSQLRLTNYEQLGGVKGALEKQANQVYETLSDEEKPVAQCIFLALTQLGEGTEDTRQADMETGLNQRAAFRISGRIR
jgi:hypothetical protein